MRNIAITIIIFGMLLLSGTFVSVHAFSAMDLVEEMQASERMTAGTNVSGDGWAAGHYVGFIQGVFDSNQRMLNSVGKTTMGSMCIIVGAYLKTHPDRWRKDSAELLVAKALVFHFGFNKKGLASEIGNMYSLYTKLYPEKDDEDDWEDIPRNEWKAEPKVKTPAYSY